MGGKRAFVNRLQYLFDNDLYDPANEPDIADAYLFDYFKGEEWRTQKEVNQLLQKYYKAAPDGIPGNDDTGTMSAWAIFSMMGFYPDCPGSPYYSVTTPVFDKITLHLNKKYYPQGDLVIEAPHRSTADIYIKRMTLGGKPLNRFRISHQELIQGGRLKMELSNRHDPSEK